MELRPKELIFIAIHTMWNICHMHKQGQVCDKSDLDCLMIVTDYEVIIFLFYFLFIFIIIRYPEKFFFI